MRQRSLIFLITLLAGSISSSPCFAQSSLAQSDAAPSSESASSSPSSQLSTDDLFDDEVLGSAATSIAGYSSSEGANSSDNLPDENATVGAVEHYQSESEIINDADLFPPELDQTITEPSETELTSAQEAAKHAKLISELIERLKGNSDVRAVEASIALNELIKPSDIAVLAERLQDQSLPMSTRIALIEALGYSKSKIAIIPLRFEYEHGDEPAQVAALQAMGTLKHPDSIPILSQALFQAKSSQQQVAAIASLAKIKSRFALSPLERALAESPSGLVKKVATLALSRMRGRIPDTAVSAVPLGRSILLNYKGLLYYFYAPSLRLPSRPNPRLLVCMHDSGLNVEKLFKHCYEKAKPMQLALLVPLFDPVVFPDYGKFNLRGRRTDKLFLELVDYLTKSAKLETRELFLFGMGDGGGFVSRLALAYPERIGRASFVTTDPIVPDPNRLFPTGIKKSPRCPDLEFDPYKIMKSDLMVLIGPGSSYKRSATFVEYVLAYAQKYGSIPRVKSRRLKVPDDIEFATTVGLKTLFTF